MDEGQIDLAADECACDTFWGFVRYAYENDGVLILAFFFVSYVFYKLVWKVWTSAMSRLVDELDRVCEERDFYQSQVFPDLRSSDPNLRSESGENNE